MFEELTVRDPHAGAPPEEGSLERGGDDSSEGLLKEDAKEDARRTHTPHVSYVHRLMTSLYHTNRSIKSDCRLQPSTPRVCLDYRPCTECGGLESLIEIEGPDGTIRLGAPDPSRR